MTFLYEQWKHCSEPPSLKEVTDRELLRAGKPTVLYVPESVIEDYLKLILGDKYDIIVNPSYTKE